MVRVTQVFLNLLQAMAAHVSETTRQWLGESNYYLKQRGSIAVKVTIVNIYVVTDGR